MATVAPATPPRPRDARFVTSLPGSDSRRAFPPFLPIAAVSTSFIAPLAKGREQPALDLFQPHAVGACRRADFGRVTGQICDLFHHHVEQRRRPDHGLPEFWSGWIHGAGFLRRFAHRAVSSHPAFPRCTYRQFERPRPDLSRKKIAPCRISMVNPRYVQEKQARAGRFVPDGGWRAVRTRQRSGGARDQGRRSGGSREPAALRADDRRNQLLL